ncbi:MULTISPECIES: transposase [Burkholderia cepacia complex]|uniref:transposase n=1 Tax=Burkholderia cepacia complex TaxID=87882 RepID=UPI00066713D7|nr:MULTISPECIES: transposase [Burkholderia cepacia complex]RQS84350.1 transposase [Burkholderia seminalis]
MTTGAPAYVPLTDAEWKAVEHVFSTYVYQRGAPSRFSDRICLDAILHAMTIGCAFSELPENLGYPKRQALYRRALSMRSSKALPKAIAILRRDGRALPEEPQPEAEPEAVPPAPRSFGAQATIEAMQAAARARLVRGLPPDWRDDE